MIDLIDEVVRGDRDMCGNCRCVSATMCTCIVGDAEKEVDWDAVPCDHYVRGVR